MRLKEGGDHTVGEAPFLDNGVVTVEPAGGEGRVLLEALARLYAYDFSEFEPEGSDRFAFDERGEMAVRIDLDRYLHTPGAFALLLRVRGRPAGFALIDARSHRGASLDHNVGEVFVARGYRRRGVAAEAVRLILARHPGRWEAAVAQRNLAAQAFWPRALAGADVRRLTRHEADGPDWRGPIWSFTAG